jgi:hypothetical protein
VLTKPSLIEYYSDKLRPRSNDPFLRFLFVFSISNALFLPEILVGVTGIFVLIVLHTTKYTLWIKISVGGVSHVRDIAEDSTHARMDLVIQILDLS